MDRLALKKIMEQSNRTALLRKKDAKMDTSQHVNHQGFRNEVFNGKPFVLEPNFLDKLPKFGILEFDYVQMHRQINGRPISEKRLEQVIKAVHLHLMGPHINPEAIKTLFSSTVSSIPNSSTQNRRRKSTIGNTTRKKSSISGGQMEKRKSQAAIKAAQFFGTTGVPELIYYTPETFNLLDQMYHVNNFVEYGKGLKDVIEYQLPGLEKNEEKGVTQDGQVTTIEEKKNKEEESNSEEEEKEIEEKEKNAANNTRASVAKVQAHRMNSRYRRHQNREVTKLKLKAKQMTPGGDKESCTARRLLLNLQWLLANRWVTCLQSIQLLYLWPKAFADSRIELIFILFDRLADLHNFIFIMAVLTEQEAAQVFYRLGWLNVWSPIIPDNYYELNITRYEEREIAKMLVRLSIDEPGENWQGESFGWSKEENIPGWELNMSWLKDGGFPEKGYLRLEYYSGADKGGESVWPTRRELAALTLGGIPADIEKLSILVDAWSRQRRRKSTLPARARSLTEENPFD
jgi:hypothetical protein